MALGAVVLAIGFSTTVAIGRGASIRFEFYSAIAEAVVIGAIACCSTYVTSRLLPPDQLSGAFSICVASLYAAITMLFSFPIKTHAVLVAYSGACRTVIPE